MAPCVPRSRGARARCPNSEPGDRPSRRPVSLYGTNIPRPRSAPGSFDSAGAQPVGQTDKGRYVGHAPGMTTAGIEPQFRLLTDRELASLPEPEWAVAGILPAGCLAVLY